MNGLNLSTISGKLVACLVLVVALPAYSQMRGATMNETSGTYLRAEVGAFFLDLPESSPFIETDSDEKLTDLLDHYDSSRGGPLLKLAVGGTYDAFGRNVFTEARGFFTSHDARHFNEYQRTSELWDRLEAEQFGIALTELMALTAAQREARRAEIFGDADRLSGLLEAIRTTRGLKFSGWIGAIDGRPLAHTPNFAWGDTIRIHTRREVDFGGVDVIGGVRGDWRGTARKMSFFAGPSFKRLYQRTDIFSYEATNRTPDENYMTLNERLRASYYGLLVGANLDVPFKRRWAFAAEGDIGVYYLDAEYKGHQRTVLSSAMIDLPTDLKVDDSRAAATLRLKTSLRAVYFDDVVFRLGVGIEYLSHVPKVRYARAGQRYGDNVTHFPAELSYADAFGVFGTLSVRVPF